MTQLATPTEAIVHRQICDYLRFQYPHIIFNSDGAGNNLSRAQAGMSKMLRSSSGVPDLMIFSPQRGYHGFFLELKREGTKLWTKDGRCASEHIQKQHEMLEALNR